MRSRQPKNKHRLVPNGREPPAPLTTQPPPRGYDLSRLVGLLADVHGDIFALDAALARLHQMG